MELYLQCGYGFMSLSDELHAAMPHATYILSPRDVPEKSQIAFANKLHRNNAQVLFDPQMYAPRSDKPNFKTYRYRPDGCKTGDGNMLDGVLSPLYELNQLLGCRAFILPSYKIDHVNTKAIGAVQRILCSAEKFSVDQYLTLCLTQIVLLDEAQVNLLLHAAESWNVKGVYLIAEHPDSDYFVDNPVWMFQLMRLCAGLRLQGKKVIVGYSNHQMLLLACTGVEAIASGNWMNTRSFTFDKFQESTDIKRHKLWYYAPQALSEYSIPYLDVAYDTRMLKLLDSGNVVSASPAKRLFAQAIKPSLCGYNQSDSFIHYLLALDAQRKACQADGTYLGKKKYLIELFSSARKVLECLSKYRISGQNRDFSELISVNETALSLFDAELGMRMSFAGVD